MILRNITRSIVISSLGLGSAYAVADSDLDYSYLDLSYVVVDADIYQDSDTLSDFVDETQDGKGYALSASYGFQNNVFVFGSYSNFELDFDVATNTDGALPGDIDVKTLVLGVGYAIPINRYTHFVSSIAYLDRDLGEFSLGQTDQDVFDDDTDVSDAIDDLNEDSSDGYAIEMGLRSQTTTWLELYGGVRYTELDAGDGFTAVGHAMFEVSDYVAIGLKVDVGDELSTYQLAARLTY
jgi:hypothetical protein